MCVDAKSEAEEKAKKEAEDHLAAELVRCLSARGTLALTLALALALALAHSVLTSAHICVPGAEA